jgi:hypothetical protein
LTQHNEIIKYATVDIFLKLNYDAICKLSTSRLCFVTPRGTSRVNRRLAGFVGPGTSVDALEKRNLSHCGQSKIRPAVFHPLV